MSADRVLPFSRDTLEEVAAQYGTPLFVYDEQGIRDQAQALHDAFAWSPDYVNYFAVKATPTPGILRVIAQAGMGFDCSSEGELVMVSQEGLAGSGIFYTSNNTPDRDYRLAAEQDAVINVDKYQYVEQVRLALGGILPAKMAIRLNPGKEKAGNLIIGNPEESKFGDTPGNVLRAFRAMQAHGVEHIGLHTMVASNEKNPDYFAETAHVLRRMVELAFDQTGVQISFLDIGGGLGINYRPGEEPVDVKAVGEAIQSELEDLDIPVVSEHGRFVTGPAGYLLTQVTHGIVETFEPFVQVDTSVNNATRLTTVKGAYHDLTVLGREGDPTQPMSVTGSMCAHTDKMFRGRELPTTIQPGDLIVVHDAGAHVRANSHNYNMKLRAGEVLVHPDGTHHLIRRRETLDDLFATTRGL